MYIIAFSKDKTLTLGHFTNLKVLFPVASMALLHCDYIKILNGNCDRGESCAHSVLHIFGKFTQKNKS